MSSEVKQYVFSNHIGSCLSFDYTLQDTQEQMRFDCLVTIYEFSSLMPFCFSFAKLTQNMNLYLYVRNITSEDIC